MVDDNTWPPEPLASFTPLLLIHRQDICTPEQVTTMAELMHAGDFGKVSLVTGGQCAFECAKLDSHKKFQKVLGTNRATNEIKEIIAPLEQSKESSLILIEGPPGIGKSVLLKEIAYRWGKKQLLQNFKLVLLVYLRDTSMQQAKSVDDLLQLFYKGHKNATEVVSACSEYLSKDGGKSITLLLDGYDEYPEHLQKCSLIADILKRQILPLCGLVISSRSHASQCLRQKATIRVDILGFTETEREQYIKQALPNQSHKVKELTQYLHQQPSVDSICFIPFNMAILLYLYKLGISLPKNPTDLYNHFICSTICRHLFKYDIPVAHDITDLTDLPEPYNKVLKQLSKLSLEALNHNKLTFTLDEIISACPDIATIPGAINGFGLLQAVQYFGLYAKTMTLNFIHLKIQEFLAAHYISHLPPDKELNMIKAIFWNNIHFSMFTIYISLTKGQRPSFKMFLSGGNKAITISQEFLKDQLKCICLYHYFNKADNYILCNAIEHAVIFDDKVIDLGGTTLTFSDMECISLFLTSSFNKEWVELNLSDCYIQDKGLNILYHGLYHSDVTINELVLSYNGLTTQSSSLIRELTVKCKVKFLWINDNYTIGEDCLLYSMLTNSCNVLEKLFMDNIKLSPKAANELFKALHHNDKLKKLNIESNAITDDACDVITAVLKRNKCLVKLYMGNNSLSSEAIINIVQCLEVNSVLQLLGFSRQSQSIQDNIRSLQEVINKNRESQGCQMKLKVKYYLTL